MPSSRMIPLLTPDDLDRPILENLIHPDLEHTYYWSPSWDPAFYIELARAGFISISIVHPDHGPLLLPELQARYAVLDWEDLHASMQLRKLLRSARLQEEEIELRIVDEPDRVIERLVEQHTDPTWLTAPYLTLLRQLPANGDPEFSLHGIELWSRKRNLLVAGELGYSIGRTYTSLSGFHTRSTTAGQDWRHFGTLQLWMLSRELCTRGYAFWNLGHPDQAYKQAIGAKIVDRDVFLQRWLDAIRESPDVPVHEAPTK